MKPNSLNRLVLPMIAAVFVTSLASAQEVPNARDAAKQLFKTGKRATIVNILRPDLVPESLLSALKQAPQIQKYYEAFAASPSEGMSAPSAFLAVNYHSAAGAHAAAISVCNAKKKKASQGCVVVAEFLPKGYTEPRAFSLSANATVAFKKYRRAGKNKAFAISEATGQWGQAVKAASTVAAQSAALAECTAKGAKDCRIVSLD